MLIFRNDQKPETFLPESGTLFSVGNVRKEHFPELKKKHVFIFFTQSLEGQNFG